MPTAEEIFNEMALRMSAVVTAEVYARVSHVPMLSHYTSVEALRSILHSRELWFSLIRDTNDTSEAIEGTRIIGEALGRYGPEIFPNYSELDAPRQFNARKDLLEKDTYVLSLCEHGGDQKTDRLVMWQAYGYNGHGLCMVLRKQAMLGQTAKGRFPVHWCPIEYEDAAGLEQRVRRRLQQVHDVINVTPGANAVPARAIGMLISVCVVPLVIGHKNVAFEHEKELQFVRSRLLQQLVPPDGAGYRTVMVDGHPKSKFVLPLRNYPEFSIDASISALLDHVIIGPSGQQEHIAQEVRELLDTNGLGHVEVHRSIIPYRPIR